jgi:hypothetical protein
MAVVCVDEAKTRERRPAMSALPSSLTASVAESLESRPREARVTSRDGMPEAE